MPRGLEITDQNKGKIKAYHDLQLSIREITARKGIPKSTVADFIKDLTEIWKMLQKCEPEPKHMLGNFYKRSNSDLKSNVIKKKLILISRVKLF